ncbi:MAG: response regulator [Alphaproteobacteria bacterium]|jgi:FixJ family two-component response regulator
MPTRKPVIAILEDDASLLRALGRLLWAYGYGVETYASAEEYLKASGTSSAALLIVDMHLGDVSGLDIIRWLRLSENNKPFICMSGSGNESVKQSALETGASAYLDKPFSLDLLTDLVRRIVGPVHSSPCSLH